MENQKQLYSLQPLEPLTTDDLLDGESVLVIPDDVLQLQADTLNVYEGRVAIETFSEEYQEKIKNYYRFSATRYNESNPIVAKRTTDTLDIV